MIGLAWVLACGGQGPASSANFLHYDRLGSVVVVTHGGTSLMGRTYRPFGSPRGATSSNQVVDNGFGGNVSDNATGLVDFPSREYDPARGRWLSPDPVFTPNALGLLSNTFAYASNRPGALVDPLGAAEEAAEPLSVKSQYTEGEYNSDGTLRNPSDKAMALDPEIRFHLPVSMTDAQRAKYRVKITQDEKGTLLQRRGRKDRGEADWVALSHFKTGSKEPDIAWSWDGKDLYAFQRGVDDAIDDQLKEYYDNENAAFVAGHPSISGGDPINGWGRPHNVGSLRVDENGYLTHLSNASGHYQPENTYLTSAIQNIFQGNGNYHVTTWGGFFQGTTPQGYATAHDYMAGKPE